MQEEGRAVKAGEGQQQQKQRLFCFHGGPGVGTVGLTSFPLSVPPSGAKHGHSDWNETQISIQGAGGCSDFHNF